MKVTITDTETTITLSNPEAVRLLKFLDFIGDLLENKYFHKSKTIMRFLKIANAMYIAIMEAK